jgi:hypothetical protein
MLNSSRGPRGSSKHRPGFHALVLAGGYIAGGAVQAILRLVLPSGWAKDFLTAGVSSSIGPLPINLVLLNFSLGPVLVEVSLLAVLGVIIAYLIARSLF